MEIIGLKAEDHPFLIRLLVAVFISAVFALPLGIHAVNALRVLPAIFGILLVLTFWVAFVGLLLNLKKSDLSLSMLGCLPLIAILNLFNLTVFARVINVLPAMIIAIVWFLGMFLAQRIPKHTRIAIYTVTAAIIALTIFFSVPRYSHARAQGILAAELDINIEQIGPGMGFMHSIQNVGSMKPTVFIGSYYFFDAEVEGTITSYFFDPYRGKLTEAPPYKMN